MDVYHKLIPDKHLTIAGGSLPLAHNAGHSTSLIRLLIFLMAANAYNNCCVIVGDNCPPFVISGLHSYSGHAEQGHRAFQCTWYCIPNTCLSQSNASIDEL